MQHGLTHDIPTGPGDIEGRIHPVGVGLRDSLRELFGSHAVVIGYFDSNALIGDGHCIVCRSAFRTHHLRGGGPLRIKKIKKTNKRVDATARGPLVEPAFLPAAHHPWR